MYRARQVSSGYRMNHHWELGPVMMPWSQRKNGSSTAAIFLWRKTSGRYLTLSEEEDAPFQKST
jgi:hypothetical protein